MNMQKKLLLLLQALILGQEPPDRKSERRQQYQGEEQHPNNANNTHTADNTNDTNTNTPKPCKLLSPQSSSWRKSKLRLQSLAAMLSGAPQSNDFVDFQFRVESCAEILRRKTENDVGSGRLGSR